VHVDGYRVRSVTLDDAPDVQALLELDPATFELVEGAPLRPDEAAEVITELPPGVPPERKYNFLLEPLAPAPDQPTAAALLSLVDGFPEERTWYLGLIIVAPAARGQGLGTRAIEALCTYARERGGAALRLAVVPANTGARRLYDRLGFAFVARRPRECRTGVIDAVDVLERRLT
jgi:ribosomal protein S18 acetylase RimI-like enzyme